MNLDWKQIAADVLEEARREANGLFPSFLAIAVDPSPATRSYLSIKKRQAERAGIRMEVCELPLESTTEEVVAAVRNAQEGAVIVQLPLPDSIDTEAVLGAIPVEKDADVLSPQARSELRVMHPIAASVADILSRAGKKVEGAKVAVVGQGWLVGRPVAEWLLKEGAQVSVVTKEEGDLKDALSGAEVVVSGAGSPGIVTKSFVEPGAIVIDVGTSELGGSLMGDVEEGVAEVAGLLTPVPGGVGPIAVAYLMKNVATLSRLQASESGVH